MEEASRPTGRPGAGFPLSPWAAKGALAQHQLAEDAGRVLPPQQLPPLPKWLAFGQQWQQQPWQEALKARMPSPRKRQPCQGTCAGDPPSSPHTLLATGVGGGRGLPPSPGPSELQNASWAPPPTQEMGQRQHSINFILPKASSSSSSSQSTSYRTTKPSAALVQSATQPEQSLAAKCAKGWLPTRVTCGVEHRTPPPENAGPAAPWG